MGKTIEKIFIQAMDPFFVKRHTLYQTLEICVLGLHCDPNLHTEEYKLLNVGNEEMDENEKGDNDDDDEEGWTDDEQNEENMIQERTMITLEDDDNSCSVRRASLKSISALIRLFQNGQQNSSLSRSIYRDKFYSQVYLFALFTPCILKPF